MKLESYVLKVIGYILFAMAVCMIPSLIFDICNGYKAEIFLIPIIVCLIVSSVLLPFTKSPHMIKPVYGILMIAVVWFIAIIVGSIPFYLAGLDVADSIFESTSGLTTTGSTILTDIESWSPGILLWRSMMQWLGGIAIIIIFMFLLPTIGIGGREFFGNETSGSGTGTFTAKMRDSAIQFSIIYMMLTAVMIVLLWISGVGLLDSLCMSFSTISTGGFMCRNDSLASFSPVVKVIAAVFMFLGGTNFYLHYKSIKGKNFKEHARNEEFKFMIIWVIMVIVITCYFLYWNLNPDARYSEDFSNIMLNVVSAVTTTGFVSSDYSFWCSSAIALLFAAMMIGSSSGSTSGGMKVGRILIMIKFVYASIKNNLHPKAVYDVKLNGSSVDNTGVSSAITIVTLFFFTMLVGTAVLLMTGLSFLDSFTVIVANLTTFGPAIGTFGPYGSYASFEWYIKIFLSIIMWLGRLEILTGLVLVTPTFWKELIRSRRKKLGKWSEKGFRH